MLRSKTILVLTSAIVLIGVCRLRAEGGTSAPADDKPAAVAVKAPSTLAQIAKRRAELRAEMDDESLKSATKPATTQPIEPATQPADVATNLYLSLVAYDRALEELQVARDRADRLKSDEAIKKLKVELDDYEARTRELDQKIGSGRKYAEVHKHEEVKDRYEKLNQEHDTQVKAHTMRVEKLEGFDRRRKDANAQVAAARKRHQKALAEYAIRTTTAKADADRGRLRFEPRLAGLDLEMALARVEALGLEQALLNQEQRRWVRRRAALQPYVQALRLWMNALEEASAESERKRIQTRLKDARTAHERVYWQAAEEIQEAYEWFEKYDNDTRSRFPQSEVGKLEGKIARSERSWRTFLDSLSRRSGQEVLTRYREVQASLAEAREYGDRLTDRLDVSLAEYEAVCTRQDKVTEQIDVQRDALAAELAKAADEGARRLESELDERQDKLVQQANDIVALQEELIERLTESIEKHGAYVEQLEQYRSRLYWSYLIVRDQGLTQFSWAGLRSDWAGDGRRPGEALRNVTDEGRDQFGAVAGLRWAVAGLLLVVAVPLGWYLHRGQLSRAVRLEGELDQRIHDEGIEAAGIDDRVRLAIARLVGETAVLVCVLLALLLGLLVLGVGGLTYRLTMTAIVFLLAVRLSFGAVRALFLRARPRFRIIRCSNKVASYYIRWLRALLWVTLVAVPLPLALHLLDVMPVTRGYLWKVYKIVALLMLLRFLFRKRLVLKVVGRPENLRAPWLYSLVAGLYPLIPLDVFGLLVLEVLGFGALTNYILRNTALTLTILAGVTTLTSYAADLARRYRRAFEQERLDKQESTEDVAAGPAGTETVTAGQETIVIDVDETGEAEFLVGLARLLSSWAVRLVGLVLILRVWGITLVEIQSALTVHVAGVSLWRLLAAVVAVALGVVLSRSVRSVLNTRVYPAYPLLDRGARAAINTILHYFLVVLGIYVAMQLVHVSLAALTVLLGTLGLGLGLGLQPLFINFISGLIIFFERHIKVGDTVEVGDKIGVVTNISMRSTSIKTFDNIDMIIPNGEFITNKVVNWSLQDRKIRGHLDIGVAYGTDVELVRKLLLQVADEHLKVLKDPLPAVWFTDFGDSALTFRLLVWFGDLSERITSLTELRFAIDKIFAEHGIDIPFPQRTFGLIGDKPLRVEISGPEPERRAGPPSRSP